MGKIHFLKPEDSSNNVSNVSNVIEFKSKKTNSYRNLCYVLAAILIIENLVLFLK